MLLDKIITLYIFLFLFFILLFLFFFTRKPITKIIILAFSYNVILFFIIYNLYLFNVEKTIMDFTILIIFSCLINILSGIFIINNVIKKEHNE